MTAPIEMIAVCTYNKRASTQHSRSYFLKTGESAWGRDVDNCCVRCLSAETPSPPTGDDNEGQ